LGTGQGNQASLGGSIEFTFSTRLILHLATQCCFQPLLNEALANPLDGGDADFHGFRDLLVNPSRSTFGLIGLEQDAGVNEFLGRRFAGGDQPC